jgi:hypothetical protein
MLLKFLIFCFAFVSILASRFHRQLSTVILATAMSFFAFVFSFIPTIQYYILPVNSSTALVSERLSVGSGTVETVALNNATLFVVSGFNSYDYMAFYIFLVLLIICIVDLFMLGVRIFKRGEE